MARIRKLRWRPRIGSCFRAVMLRNRRGTGRLGIVGERRCAQVGVGEYMLLSSGSEPSHWMWIRCQSSPPNIADTYRDGRCVLIAPQGITRVLGYVI